MNIGSDLKELQIIMIKEKFTIHKLEYELAKLKYNKEKRNDRNKYTNNL